MKMDHGERYWRQLEILSCPHGYCQSVTKSGKSGTLTCWPRLGALDIYRVDGHACFPRKYLELILALLQQPLGKVVSRIFRAHALSLTAGIPRIAPCIEILAPFLSCKFVPPGVVQSFKLMVWRRASDAPRGRVTLVDVEVEPAMRPGGAVRVRRRGQTDACVEIQVVAAAHKRCVLCACMRVCIHETDKTCWHTHTHTHTRSVTTKKI